MVSLWRMLIIVEVEMCRQVKPFSLRQGYVCILYLVGSREFASELGKSRVCLKARSGGSGNIYFKV